MSEQKIENEVLDSLRKAIEGYKEIDIEKISQEEVQSLFALSVQLYFLKRDTGEDFGPFANPQEISATAAMTAAANLLQAVEIEVFELGMWKSLTGA
jgi:hypothetical protein